MSEVVGDCVSEGCVDEVRCAGGLEDMGLLKEIGGEDLVIIGVDGRVG